ncbi:MAG: hypothetical protein ACTTIV_07540 [Campylobacter sp.]
MRNFLVTSTNFFAKFSTDATQLPQNRQISQPNFPQNGDLCK